MDIPEPIPETNHFRFGNSQSETSEFSVRMPVNLARRPGTIKAAVVKGRAPLLVSRKALQTLQAVIDFGNDKLTLFSDRRSIPLTTNEAGQYVVNVLDAQPSTESPFSEVMMNHEECPIETSMSSDQAEPSREDPASASKPLDHAPGVNLPLQVWSRHDSYIHHVPTTGKQGPNWQSVKRRRVLNSETCLMKSYR